MDREKILKSKYIFNTEVTSKDLECTKKQCYSYGYLDGYFDEVVYEENLEMCDIHKKYYNLGYQDGVNDRLNIKDMDDYKLCKGNWIKAIADYDDKNNVKIRKLSRNSLGMYNSFREEKQV